MNKRELTSKIPKIFSEAILAAVNDLSKVERSKKYRVNMSDWHTPIEASPAMPPDPSSGVSGCSCSSCQLGRAGWPAQPAVCEVCFAGSLMAMTLEVPSDVSCEPGSCLTPSASKAMRALNSVRLGYLEEALISWPWGPKAAALKELLAARNGYIPVPPYSKETSREFKAAMRKIAKYLQSLGV